MMIVFVFIGYMFANFSNQAEYDDVMNQTLNFIQVNGYPAFDIMIDGQASVRYVHDFFANPILVIDTIINLLSMIGIHKYSPCHITCKLI